MIFKQLLKHSYFYYIGDVEYPYISSTEEIADRHIFNMMRKFFHKSQRNLILIIPEKRCREIYLKEIRNAKV